MKTYKSVKNNSFTNFFLSLPVLLLLLNAQSFSQQITGLDGWNIYLDPGHSQNENMGIYNYSEAEKNSEPTINKLFHFRKELIRQMRWVRHTFIQFTAMQLLWGVLQIVH